MRLMIELSMVLGSRLQPNRRNRSQDDDSIYRDTDEPGEGIASSAAASPQADPSVEATTPVYVNPDSIRSFYRRQPDRAGDEPKVGTRIVFNDGGYIKVTDPVSDVLAKITGEQQG